MTALDTLLPPNFMTIHGESAIPGGAPNAALSSNNASVIPLMRWLISQSLKKNPQGITWRVC